MRHAISHNVRPSLNDRLAQFATDFRIAADRFEPGSERDALIAKARAADVAIEMNVWLSSSELRSPT